jgi:Flp pilus assembly protein protease CpaA
LTVVDLREVLTWIVLASLLALLGLAALTDLRERRIPNWLTVGTAALYPVYVLSSPAPVAWLGALGAAAAVFILGLVLFARQLIGGGDVKLIAAVTLWAGVDQLALFALVTSLAGGALALGSLWYRRWHGLIGAHMAALGWNLAPAGGTRPTSSACSEAAEAVSSTSTGQATITLPYGIAIAAGGLAVVAELMKH